MDSIYKRLVISLLTVVCFLLLLVVNLEYQTDIIYTHIFYLPIFIAVLWFGKKGIYLALFLGSSHLLINYYYFHTLFSGPVIRSVSFATFALLAHLLLLRFIHEEPSQDIANDPTPQQRNLVGNMALTIGEEVRNSMASTKAFLQLFENEENVSKKEFYDIVIDEIDKTNETLNDYILLSSKVDLDLDKVELADLVRELQPLIMELCQPFKILVEWELADGPLLLLDKKQISKMIIHLIRNSIEAMPNGGNLIVKTISDSKQVILSVEDQGPGFEPEILTKIGAPFISTKESHSGLGLAICHSILLRHNASIKVVSKQTGTIFHCIFPVNDELEVDLDVL